MAGPLCPPSSLGQEPFENSAASENSRSLGPPDDILEDGLFDLDEVVVTGSRRNSRLEDTAIATELITADTIEASGATNVADLLEEQQGLYVQRSFAGSGVRLQGLDPDYTLILIDGQRTTGRIGGTNDLTRIPIEQVERVEIVRGAASAAYGSDALAGVINVITRQTEERYELEARGAYGNLGLMDLSARAGLAREHGSVQLTAGYQRGDGFDLDPDDIATQGNAFDQLILGLNTRWQPSNDDDIRLGIDYLYRDQNGIDSNATGAVFDRSNRTETYSARLDSSHSLSSSTALRSWLGASRFRDQFLLDQRGATAMDRYQDTREALFQGGMQLDWESSASNIISAGVEGFYEHLATQRLVNGESDRYRGAVFFQSEWKVIDGEAPSLSLVPGVRLDLDSDFGSHLTPRLALRFDPVDRVTLRASYGFGFRAPNFREQYLFFQNPGVGYVVEGNPDLKPETSRSLNVHMDYRVSDTLLLSVHAFRNDLNDMILTVQTEAASAAGPSRYRYENAASAFTQGAELSLRWEPLNELAIQTGYTLLHTRNEELSRPLSDRPTHRGTASLTYTKRAARFQVSLRAALVGSRPFYLDTDADGEDEAFEANSYATLDLRLEQGIGEYISLFLHGENLLDAGDPASLAIQPRTAMGGVKLLY